MITRNIPFQQMPQYPFNKEFDITKLVFFDIETTGLAADSSYLYLIGCSFCQNNSFQLIQWFSEDIREEAVIITAFFEFIKNFDVIIHYNGSGFDLPYLHRKCKQLGLDYSFDGIKNIDIYKRITPYKKILRINNLKQKTVEVYLNINRTDPFSGGDLIEVYASYLGKKHYEDLRKLRQPEFVLTAPSEAELLLHQLLLHNEDDIKGLILICPILYYADLFEKQIRILKATVEKNILTIQFETSATLPVKIHFKNSIAELIAFDHTASLSIQIFEGELKYFYDNYKDYYYLPEEDRVIHKSLAEYVDKGYRIKAKPSTCYAKKHGTFAPQYEIIDTPYFKQQYQDKLTYLEVHTDFLLQEDKLERYTTHILYSLLSKS